MNPIFKFPGGKRGEIKHFEKYYPENFDLYIEPFVGGGSVFFDLNFNNNIIADINSEIINFYNTIKCGCGKEILDLVNKFSILEEGYYHIRNTYKPNTDIEYAARFFYLRKTCFRGFIRYNKSGKFNVPYGNYKKVDYLSLLDKNYSELLKKTNILNYSFEDIFKKYNDKDNFMFLDPPYHQVFSDYDKSGFIEKDHFNLSECFKKTKNKCLLIMGKTFFIKELYKDYIIEEYDKKYSIDTKEEKSNSKHLIIKNY